MNMFVKWILLFCALAYNILKADEVQRLLESDFSPDVVADLNTTKEYKPFNLTEFDTLSRRFDIFWYNLFAVKHVRSRELYERACYLISITYQMAYPEIQRYYNKRFLYVNNLEYEVGYLVHEIVWKYQMMLEIYQLVYKRFFLAQDKNFAPVSYMFHMYTNELEYSMAIIHLCNMLHELEKKYKDLKTKSIFADYVDASRAPRTRRRRNKTSSIDEKESYFKRHEEEKKRKRKERRKERKKFEQMGVFVLTTPARRVTNKNRGWPVLYGWSIEDW